MGFPCSSVGKESTCNAGDSKDTFGPWIGKIPLEKEMAIHSRTLSLSLGKPMDRGACQKP